MPATTALHQSPDSHDVAHSSGIAVKLPSNTAEAMAVDYKKEYDDLPPSDDSSVEEVFKEGGYGWVVVLCVALINAHTWGLNSSYAVFLAYYLRSGTFAGGSPTAFAFVGGLSVSMALLVSPLATTCIRLYGTRATLLTGVVFETVAFVGASFTTEIWHLLLSQGVAFGIGMGFCFVGSVSIVPQWFDKRRSFANSLAASGSGFGGLAYSLATDAMIRNISLAWAFRILAIIVCIVNGVCSVLIRDRNKATGAVHVAFHKQLFRRIEFYLFVAWGFFSLLGYNIVVFSLPDFGHTVGLTATQGSILASLFNLSQALGRPAIGYVSDSFGRINVAALGTLVAALTSLFIWTFAGKEYAGVIVYSLFGCFAGVLWATVAAMGVEVIGIQLLPSALSVLWLVLVLPATFSEVIGLNFRKPGVDGYLNVQIFTGLMYFVAFIAAWLLRAWKLHQVELAQISRDEEARALARRRQDGVPDDDTVAAPLERSSFKAYLMKGTWIFKAHPV